MRRAVLITRQAISPRLAIRIFENIRYPGEPQNCDGKVTIEPCWSRRFRRLRRTARSPCPVMAIGVVVGSGVQKPGGYRNKDSRRPADKQQPQQALDSRQQAAVRLKHQIAVAQRGEGCGGEVERGLDIVELVEP